MKDFATREKPLRISSLPTLLKCPGFRMFEMFSDDDSSMAATNGTCVGRAVELWHNGSTVEEALEVATSENPTAQASLVQQWLRGYASDWRNQSNGHPVYGKVIPESQEITVELERDGVYVVGHIDHAREDRQGIVWVCDLKASNYHGSQLVKDYAAQQALYTLACMEHPLFKGRYVRPGAIIRMTDYKVNGAPGPVFYDLKMTVEGCIFLWQQVVEEVRQIRRGKIRISPGPQCVYCNKGGMVPGNCRAVLDKLAVSVPACQVCGSPATSKRAKSCGSPICKKVLRGQAI